MDPTPSPTTVVLSSACTAAVSACESRTHRELLSMLHKESGHTAAQGFAQEPQLLALGSLHHPRACSSGHCTGLIIVSTTLPREKRGKGFTCDAASCPRVASSSCSSSCLTEAVSDWAAATSTAAAAAAASCALEAADEAAVDAMWWR